MRRDAESIAEFSLAYSASSDSSTYICTSHAHCAPGTVLSVLQTDSFYFSEPAEVGTSINLTDRGDLRCSVHTASKWQGADSNQPVLGTGVSAVSPLRTLVFGHLFDGAVNQGKGRRALSQALSQSLSPYESGEGHTVQTGYKVQLDFR